jgi:hypothetical protein
MKTASAKTAIIIYSALFVLSVSRQFIQCTNSVAGHAQKTAIKREYPITADTSKKPTEIKQSSHMQTFEIETWWKGELQLNKSLPVKKKPVLTTGCRPAQH